MKKTKAVLLAVLLLAAALLGWFLPAAVFCAVDKSLEGKPEPLSLRQIDLSYRSDLQIEDRLSLIRDHKFADSTYLKRGVYQDAEKVRGIAQEFLSQLTGNEQTLTENNCSVQPVLLNFGNDGVFIAWNLTADLNEAWTFNAVLDDQTGLIFGCSCGCMALNWDRLFSGLSEAQSMNVFIYERMQEAIGQHYRARLSAPYTAAISEDDSEDTVFIGNIVLCEGERVAFRIPYLIVIFEGVLRIGL